MKRIIKDQEPEFWTKYKRKNPKIEYAGLATARDGNQIRARMRNHLASQQKSICCYCCRALDREKNNAIHIEHVKPRDQFPALSMEYSNLLASCSSDASCDKAKGKQYDSALFVSPLDEDCESLFEYLTDGSIKGRNERAEWTIKTLNLNEPNLRQARKTLYEDCCLMAEAFGREYVRTEYMEEKEGRLPRFVDMVEYFYHKRHFDF